ncbi:hypothetical protein [Helicobacter fennelliae]|uniref:Uncharacterized protein n=1 Tax=Helicobacter fennelliae MRY12-0050 TaxID=1325130 RepID=T1DX13_9HELI|nr:hypothetical protein [Helicobacter fennelliae]GAD19867.1 hypothetical protein HFN_1107 [Helicobacter fennelliae MRY12-0050]STP08051.1 Uncharacterised protein [Helicobacter fennelliae]
MTASIFERNLAIAKRGEGATLSGSDRSQVLQSPNFAQKYYAFIVCQQKKFKTYKHKHRRFSKLESVCTYFGSKLRPNALNVSKEATLCDKFIVLRAATKGVT